MPRRSLYERWIAAVYASKLSPAARDTLVVYGLHMLRGGIIRIDLRTVAEWTGRDTRNVSRHISAARQLGLLEHVRRPSHGRPAVNRATVPDDLRIDL